MMEANSPHWSLVTRRTVLGTAVVAGAALGGVVVHRSRNSGHPVVVFKASSYTDDLRRRLVSGMAELGWNARRITGKKVLLKPNLVEPSRISQHINTHPLLIQAAIEAFRALGASHVSVGEGAGHVRDPYYILEESGLLEPLAEDRTPFIDLNFDSATAVPNRGKRTRLSHLMLPRAVVEADVLVSLAKMKTHHYAGVTLSMKNLFGILPGAFYGWPKNVLHVQGLNESILDINTTVRPHLAIIDGIVGMGGDGPIMGTPVNSGVVVLGTSLPAVDATAARIMGFIPEKIPHLLMAEGTLGTIRDEGIVQRGEQPTQVRIDFPLVRHIPAFDILRGLKMSGMSEKESLGG